MSTRFSGLKAKNYKFLHEDGNHRNVIALYAGSKRIGFMEYDNARKLVDRLHDLVDEHERKSRDSAPKHRSSNDDDLAEAQTQSNRTPTMGTQSAEESEEK